jgi:hypothetical protein
MSNLEKCQKYLKISIVKKYSKISNIEKCQIFLKMSNIEKCQKY